MLDPKLQIKGLLSPVMKLLSLFHSGQLYDVISCNCVLFGVTNWRYLTTCKSQRSDVRVCDLATVSYRISICLAHVRKFQFEFCITLGRVGRCFAIEIPVWEHYLQARRNIRR